MPPARLRTARPSSRRWSWLGCWPGALRGCSAALRDLGCSGKCAMRCTFRYRPRKCILPGRTLCHRVIHASCNVTPTSRQTAFASRVIALRLFRPQTRPKSGVRLDRRRGAEAATQHRDSAARGRCRAAPAPCQHRATGSGEGPVEGLKTGPAFRREAVGAGSESRSVANAEASQSCRRQRVL